MKIHSGGLGNFLNKVTQKSEKTEGTAQIIYIDIDEIEVNPQNFYGLRNIDELAGLIAVSRMIEPLTVTKKADGKYKLISGHRRRAAVQKLLEEGVYTERKLPCIIKTPEKISIEQENGEIIEFDEDAVEMLNLIASNRGQREERTIEEKLQEIKYLEVFARALYHQKDCGKRGRFVNFFAEEILNISKSQLLRLNSLGKLTENARKAIYEKKISVAAAVEMASLAPEEQEKYLKKFFSGEAPGTAQDIHTFKNPKKIKVDKKTPKHSTAETETNLEKSTVFKIADVPEEFEDPRKEAEDWIYQASLAFYKKMYAEAERLSAEETDELKSSQWGIRAAVVRYKIEELKIQHKKNK